MNSLWAEGTVAKHLVDESGSFRLKDAAVKVYGDQEKAPQKDLNEDIKSKGGKPGADIYMGEKNLVSKYCIQDCRLTFRLTFYYLDKIEKEGLTHFFFIEEVMPLYKYVTIPFQYLSV